VSRLATPAPHVDVPERQHISGRSVSRPHMAATVRGTIRGMGQRANPAFAGAVVAVPLLALAAAVVAPLEVHTYVHVMAGVLWTGTDLFMALVLGPVLGSLDVDERASVFERFTPKTSFLLPTLATVTIASGILLVGRIPYLTLPASWLAILTAGTLVPVAVLVGWNLDAFDDRRWQVAAALAALVSVAALALTLPDFEMASTPIALTVGIVAALSVLGFGVLMPGEVRIYREMTSDDPDDELIGRIGLRNAKLAGVQGVLQLSVVVLMVSLRYGGFG